jgi:hypothetical protein
MAAGSTYTPIATNTLGSAAASYTFTSIPGTYTDLVLVVNLLGGATNYDVQVGNGSADTGSNYASTRFFGDGTSASGDGQRTNTTGVLGNISNSATVPHNFIINFNSYTSGAYKTALSRVSRPDAYAIAISGGWISTSTINTIKIYSTSAQNLPSGSSFTLYGITAA